LCPLTPPPPGSPLRPSAPPFRSRAGPHRIRVGGRGAPYLVSDGQAGVVVLLLAPNAWTVLPNRRGGTEARSVPPGPEVLVGLAEIGRASCRERAVVSVGVVSVGA